MRINLKNIGKAFLGAILCLTIGGLSGYITREAIPGWYTTLNKPFFTPPNGLFGPVWTLLYTLMGISAGLVWSRGIKIKAVKTALYFFLAQLTINALWSIVFFGMKNPGAGLLVIGLLIILILKTIQWFLKVYRPSAYLLYPYLAWVSFASALNFSIYYLN